MREIFIQLGELFVTLIGLVVAVFTAVRPALPALAWFAFWYALPDWHRLRACLGAGGWVVVAGLAGATTVIFAVSGSPALVAMTTFEASPLVAAVAKVSLFVSVALLAGALQLNRAAVASNCPADASSSDGTDNG